MILERIRKTLQCFSKFQIFHILRRSNQDADKMENKGCKLDQGFLILNEEPMALHPIPWVGGLFASLQKMNSSIEEDKILHQRVGLFD